MTLSQDVNRVVRTLPIIGAGNPVEPGFTGTRLGVCNLCEAICGLEITLEKGEITGIRGNENDPLSRGHLCPKGVALADIYNDPDRLRHPIKRTGSDRAARLRSWERVMAGSSHPVADRARAAARPTGVPASGRLLPEALEQGFRGFRSGEGR